MLYTLLNINFKKSKIEENGKVRIRMYNFIETLWKYLKRISQENDGRRISSLVSTFHWSSFASKRSVPLHLSVYYLYSQSGYQRHMVSRQRSQLPSIIHRHELAAFSSRPGKLSQLCKLTAGLLCSPGPIEIENFCWGGWKALNKARAGYY